MLAAAGSQVGGQGGYIARAVCRNALGRVTTGHEEKRTTTATMHRPIRTRRRGTDGLLAAAALGSGEAILELARSEEGRDLVVRNRLTSQIVALGGRQGLELPVSWLRQHRRSAAARIVLELALRDLGTVLDRVGVRWLPIKGMGPVADLYHPAECRPTADLDVIVAEAELDRAKAVLLAAGWIEIRDQEASPLTSTYCWKARHPSGALLELHFALWGPADPMLASALLARAEPAEQLGACALKSTGADCYLTCAAHLWNAPGPRPLLDSLDLHLLCEHGGPGFAEWVVELARRHDLQLLVGLAAAIQSSLWPDDEGSAIAAALATDLRWPERELLRRTRRPAKDLALGALVLARLLAGRRSRSGWSAPLRHLARILRAARPTSRHGPT